MVSLYNCFIPQILHLIHQLRFKLKALHEIKKKKKKKIKLTFRAESGLNVSGKYLDASHQYVT